MASVDEPTTAVEGATALMEAAKDIDAAENIPQWPSQAIVYAGQALSLRPSAAVAAPGAEDNSIQYILSDGTVTDRKPVMKFIAPRLVPVRPRQVFGTPIPGWQFSFEPLTQARNGPAESEAKPPAKPAKHPPRKNPAPPAKPEAAIATSNTSEDKFDTQAASHSAVSSTAATRTLRARQAGRAHTARIEALLKKYLGEQADGVLGAASAAAGPTAASSAADSFNTATAAAAPAKPKPPKPVEPKVYLPRGSVKCIMQAKSEQDAALRALQHAPRPFHANPVPLSVAIPSDMLPADLTFSRRSSNSLTIDSKYAVDEVEAATGARPVPLSIVEPRYALMVADDVLKKHAKEAAHASEEQQQGSGVTAAAELSSEAKAAAELESLDAAMTLAENDVLQKCDIEPVAESEEEEEEEELGSSNGEGVFSEEESIEETAAEVVEHNGVQQRESAQSEVSSESEKEEEEEEKEEISFRPADEVEEPKAAFEEEPVQGDSDSETESDGSSPALPMLGFFAPLRASDMLARQPSDSGSDGFPEPEAAPISARPQTARPRRSSASSQGTTFLPGITEEGSELSVES